MEMSLEQALETLDTSKDKLLVLEYLKDGLSGLFPDELGTAQETLQRPDGTTISEKSITEISDMLDDKIEEVNELIQLLSNARLIFTKSNNADIVATDEVVDE